MKLLLSAAALTCALALPAFAQTGAEDDGDWTQITTNDGSPNLILIDGPAKRNGDVAELAVTFIYPEPGKNNLIGGTLKSVITCSTRSDDASVLAVIYANREPVVLPKPLGGPAHPLPADSPLLSYACGGTDRTGIRHFTQRSRRAVVIAILGHYPGE